MHYIQYVNVPEHDVQSEHQVELVRTEERHKKKALPL